VRAVALAEGVDVRKLSRGAYLARGKFGYRFDKIGTWGQVRMLAALEDGEPPTERDPKESEGARQEIGYARKLERQIGRAEWFADRLDSSLARAIERQPIMAAEVRKPVALRKEGRAKATLTALLSDLHFGVSVDPVECHGSEFSWQIACRRLAKVAEQCADWKPEKRDLTDLVLVLNGDIIEGVIHLDSHLIDPLSIQIVGATRALVSMIDFLRGHFRNVRVICAPGNHDRVTHRGHGRTTAQRWDSHARSIYLGLECAFRSCDDVRVEVPSGALASYKTPGEHLIVASHGDTEPTISNPGKGINTARIGEKLRAIDIARVFGSEIEVLLLGHWHQPAAFMTPHGAMVVVNGSLIGGSPFSQNGAGVWDPEPAQWIFESVAGYPFGDSRIVRLRDADARADLDATIPTPSV